MVSEQSFLGSAMADPIYELKQLQQTGDIKQYYEAFDQIQRCIQWPEEFLIRWFVAGLKWDTRKEFQFFQPQTLVQAYAYGRMYEIAYPRRRPLQSVPSQNSSSSTSLVSRVADPIYELKKLEQTGGIKEYYEAFDRIQRNINLPEEFLISWFVAGLKVDTKREVQSIRPQSLLQAYAYGRLYEIAYPKGRPKPRSQEDDAQDLQMELQNSHKKSHEEFQDSKLSTINSANIDENRVDNGVSMVNCEVSDQELADNVFDGNFRYDVMKNADELSNKVLHSEVVVKIDEGLVQIETNFEPILVNEHLELDAYHLFDKMPKSISSHETESLCQVAKLNDELIAVGLESQMFSRNSAEQNDVSRAFKKHMMHSSTTIPVKEQKFFKVYEGHCNEFKEDPCAHVFVFDPGGFIVRGSVLKLQVIKVGDSNEAKKSIQPSIDAETSLVALYQMPFDHAMDNLVFDPGGGNQKRVPKEMREATVDEFMLEDRALGEPQGDIFLQPIISKFSYYNVRDDIKFKLAEMIRFANGISHKHDVIERSSFGSRSESTIVFDPGITKGLSDHSLSALCSFLELFVIRKLLLQQLLAFEVHFPLDRRMIWFIPWEF